jgi:hypothetical protein
MVRNNPIFYYIGEAKHSLRSPGALRNGRGVRMPCWGVAALVAARSPLLRSPVLEHPWVLLRPSAYIINGNMENFDEGLFHKFAAEGCAAKTE